MPSRYAWIIAPLLTTGLFLGGPLAAHLHLVPPISGFVAFAAAAVPGLVAVISGIVILVRGNQGRGVVALTIGIIPLAVIAAGITRGRHVPRINDITTNLDNPPAFVAAAAAPDNQGKDLSYPEAFKPEVQAGYPGLISLQLDLPADQAYQLALKVAEDRPGWQITRRDPATLTIEAEETLGLFQFTDDMVVRVLPMEGSSQVDMRSRSRVGKGDFGANAQRIQAYFMDLEAARKPAAATP